MYERWRALRSAITAAPSRWTRPVRSTRHVSDYSPFRAGDYVIIRPCESPSLASHLSGPLEPSRRIDTHKGVIHHTDIIGKRVRDVVSTQQSRAGGRGIDYRLHAVRLDEYVRFTRRLVTPLYPQDAQLIVGLLDLHPEPSVWTGADAGVAEPRLEILEAGTGHGALTLYLSRAIHAANPSFPHHQPPLPQRLEESEEDHVAIEQWKAARRALIHSIEVSPKYSAHAESVVKGFRHGIYHPNVDFHVGDVGAWTRAELAFRNHEPFLSHAFLDLPGTELQLDDVAAALRTDGALVVFSPSITQITTCLSKVKEDRMPLELERVVELGVNGGSGGREWDVRAVKPRASSKKASTAVPTGPAHTAAGEEESAETSLVDEPRPDETQSPAEESQQMWKMICRPKVGERIVGGGFLGIFRKHRSSQTETR